jgi:hypothetical protein
MDFYLFAVMPIFGFKGNRITKLKSGITGIIDFSHFNILAPLYFGYLPLE